MSKRSTPKKSAPTKRLRTGLLPKGIGVVTVPKESVEGDWDYLSIRLSRKVMPKPHRCMSFYKMDRNRLLLVPDENGYAPMGGTAATNVESHNVSYRLLKVLLGAADKARAPQLVRAAALANGMVIIDMPDWTEGRWEAGAYGVQ